MKPVAVVAVGGNSLAPSGERGSSAEQRRHARVVGDAVAALEFLETGGRRAVITSAGKVPPALVGQAGTRRELRSGERRPAQVA